jgi:hypothetical protein
VIGRAVAAPLVATLLLFSGSVTAFAHRINDPIYTRLYSPEFDAPATNHGIAQDGRTIRLGLKYTCQRDQ